MRLGRPGRSLIAEELNDYQESILQDSKTGQPFALPSATTQIQENIDSAFNFRRFFNQAIIISLQSYF